MTSPPPSAAGPGSRGRLDKQDVAEHLAEESAEARTIQSDTNHHPPRLAF